MAKSKPDNALAGDTDEYLALNDQLQEVLSEVADLSESLEKAERKMEFDPSILKSLLGELRTLTKRMGEMAEHQAKAPTINVEPKITLPAPNVSIRTDTPKKWRVEVDERDEDTGRIKTLTIEAAK